MRSGRKLFGAVIVLAALCLALPYVENEGALGAILLVLIYVSIPVILLSLRDFIVHRRLNGIARGPLLLHVAALFAALVGYGVYWMAVASEHPQVEKHRWFILLFPLLVYATPVLLLFQGLSLREVRDLYTGGDDDAET